MNSENSLHINDILGPIVGRTKRFIEEDVSIKIIEDSIDVIVPGMLELKHITALIHTSGALQLTIAISFDEPLIDLVTIRFCAEELSESERITLHQGVADEVINTILGNAAAEYPPHANKLIELTPPAIVSEAKSLARQKGTIIWANEIRTEAGCMSINYICKQELFDENLHYKVQ